MKQQKIERLIDGLELMVLITTFIFINFFITLFISVSAIALVDAIIINPELGTNIVKLSSFFPKLSYFLIALEISILLLFFTKKWNKWKKIKEGQMIDVF